MLFFLLRLLLVTYAGYRLVVLLFTLHIQLMFLMPKYFHCLLCATISKDSPSTSRCAKESKQTDPKSIYIPYKANDADLFLLYGWCHLAAAQLTCTECMTSP